MEEGPHAPFSRQEVKRSLKALGQTGISEEELDKLTEAVNQMAVQNRSRTDLSSPSGHAVSAGSSPYHQDQLWCHQRPHVPVFPQQQQPTVSIVREETASNATSVHYSRPQLAVAMQPVHSNVGLIASVNTSQHETAYRSDPSNACMSSVSMQQSHGVSASQRNAQSWAFPPAAGFDSHQELVCCHGNDVLFSRHSSVAGPHFGQTMMSSGRSSAQQFLGCRATDEQAFARSDLAARASGQPEEDGSLSERTLTRPHPCYSSSLDHVHKEMSGHSHAPLSQRDPSSSRPYVHALGEAMIPHSEQLEGSAVRAEHLPTQSRQHGPAQNIKFEQAKRHPEPFEEVLQARPKELEGSRPQTQALDGVSRDQSKLSEGQTHCASQTSAHYPLSAQIPANRLPGILPDTSPNSSEHEELHPDARGMRYISGNRPEDLRQSGNERQAADGQDFGESSQSDGGNENDSFARCFSGDVQPMSVPGGHHGRKVMKRKVLRVINGQQRVDESLVPCETVLLKKGHASFADSPENSTTFPLSSRRGDHAPKPRLNAVGSSGGAHVPVRHQPASFIRPRVTSAVRSTHRSDPVSRYHQFRHEWAKHKLPGDEKHTHLRMSVREQMMHEDMPRAKSQTHRCLAMNNYTAPTEKKRQTLRWELRHQLAMRY